MTEKITINATLVFEVTSKSHWIRSFPGALPKLPTVEQYLWVDANGNTATCGEDFMHAEETGAYPIKVYIVGRTSHTKTGEYADKYKEFLGL